MKRMTYMSSFARPLADAELHQIGTHSARRNADDGITGVLLTLGSVFFQIIEGDDTKIDDLYARVLCDDRHTDIICLRTELGVTDRLFPDWAMNVFDLDHLGGDVVEPLKLMLGRMSQSQQIIERYTQPAVSRLMAQGLNPLDVPPRRVERLVLFTDMVAFSAISDRLPIEDVSALVSHYLEVCSQRIVANGGEVSKFLGDGLMAYFDPNGADDAMQSCVEILRDLAATRGTASERSPHRLLFTGFGLALGPVIEGNLGSSVKMDYTIIGEPVNTAARLEALTRTVNASVLMTSAVKQATRCSWDFTSLGAFDLGRDASTPVFALDVGAGDAPVSTAVGRLLETFSPAHRAKENSSDGVGEP